MNGKFIPEYLFTKGIYEAEFFDPISDNLLGYSKFVTDFGLNGTQNEGDVEGGIGNMLIMSIPDSTRLAITAKTADASLNNMALPMGASVAANGIVETVRGFVASSGTITIPTTACAPYGGTKAIAYVITSTGADKATVEANNGQAYPVAANGAIEGFTAVAGNTYCVRYFYRNSSAQELSIPALFAPKVVRAHFVVNVYAKEAGGDAMSSSLYKRRHYYFPRYQFTAGLQGTESNTATGTVDLSGKTLASDASIMSAADCASSGESNYGYIVDEYVGDTNGTSGIDGIYFIGGSAGLSVPTGETLVLPLKYSVDGVLTNISDISAVEIEVADTSKATVADGVVTGVSAGNTTVTATVTNAATGAEYSDTIALTVT